MTTAEQRFGPPIGGSERWTFAVVVLGASLLSGLGASYPQNTWLQVGPVVAVAAAFPWWRSWSLARGSTACLAAFLLLHLFAAHWTYTDVPYERWLRLGGASLNEWLGTERNMFDRLVHFAFGLLVVRPVVEAEMRIAQVSLRLAYRLAILFVLAISAMYEIFEWTLAILVSPEAADKYNGQQGDMFDAQKDMWLALFGAAMGLALLHWGRLFPLRR